MSSLIFPSRDNEINEIKKNFDKLFHYSSNNPINKIDTKLFIKDFSEIIQEVECPICLQFSLNPVQCSKCLRIFCKTCQINNQCSICRETFISKELDRILKNILDKLLLNCQNCRKYGSLKTINKIKVSEYSKHLYKCEFSDYQCLTCKKIIQHSKKKCYEHAHFCGYSDSSCCYCFKNIKLYLKKEHEIKCGEEIISCELCNIKLERKKLDNHKKNLCIMRIIKCKDCHENYIFKDLDAHLKEECKDNQIKYWKTRYEQAVQVLEEDFNFKCNEENLGSLRQRRIERQNTETNLFSGLSLDQSIHNERIKDKKALNPFLISSIIREKDLSFIYDDLFNKKRTNFSLIYKMSKEGENNFHKKCDNIGPTLCVCKIRKSSNSDSYNRLGGYTSLSWDCSGIIKKDEYAFIFSLTKRKVFRAKNPFYSIYCSNYYGPSFGALSSIIVKPGLWFKGKIGSYNNSETYEDPERECTCGIKDFVIDEMEVYKVSFEEDKK